MPLLETYGSYQLVEKLAVGGMAQLYLAKKVKPKGQERTVVLKRILPHLAEDTAFVTMFLDEARIAARLHHPNVVEILDLGAEGDSYFIAMEYIHGEDLRRISKKGIELSRRMPPPLVCRVVAQASRGLDYAHRRTDAQGKPLRIVHRDVSPQNILVSFDGQVKVVDFGIAKAADKATVTASGVIKGKHAYMSPEQALGRDIDHRTDVFALGIVLYETLTATRLFRRATDLQTLKAVSECRVDPPSRVFPGVPAQLDAIIMKALAKDLNERYQRADELADALEGWLGDRPDGSVEAVGRYVSELFSDRLVKEKSEGKFMPTKSQIDFGSGSSRVPSGKAPTAQTASLRVDKKTVTDVNDAHVPASPLESRSTDLTPALYMPITEPVPAASRRDKSSTELSQPLELEVLDPEPPTISSGKVVVAGGTQLYGKVTPGEGKTLLEPASKLVAQEQQQPPEPQLLPVTVRDSKPVLPRLNPATPSQDQRTLVDPSIEATLRPARPSMWPWWLAAGLTTVAVAAVVTKVLVDRRVLLEVKPVVAAAAPQPAPAPPVAGAAPKEDAAPAEAPKPPEKPKLAPSKAVPVEGPTLALVRREGQLFASLSGDKVEQGAALQVVGPERGGTKDRDFYGVASVLEVRDGQARILFDESEGELPDGLFVTHEPKDKGPYAKPAAKGATLIGSLQLKQGEPQADVALKNATDFDWSQCEVRLPDNRSLKLGPSVLVKAGGTQWISGSAFKARGSSAADAKQKDGFAHVKCAEGDGWLKAAMLP